MGATECVSPRLTSPTRRAIAKAFDLAETLGVESASWSTAPAPAMRSAF